MRVVLSLTALMIAAPVLGDDMSRAKAAIALAKAQRDRDDYTGKATAALALAKSQRGQFSTDYASARAKAQSDGRPLFLWVAMTPDQAIVSAFPEAVHCSLPSLSGDATPRLIFGYVQVNNLMFIFRRGELNSYSPQLIRESLRSPPVLKSRAETAWRTTTTC